MKFFGEVISIIDTLDNAEQYAQHNFSSSKIQDNPRKIHSLSKESNVNIISSYIVDNIEGNSYCDIGGASAVLANKMLELGYDAYCIDGSDYGVKNNTIIIPIDRYAVFDMRTDITPYINNKFDIVTSFEMLEHIPEEDIQKVLNNIKHISKIFIGSVHVGGAQIFNHYNIKSLEWWTELLSKFGQFDVLSIKLENFDESYIIKVVF